VTGTEVARRTPQQLVIDSVRKDEFLREIGYALPENVPAKRFVRAAVTAVLQNPALAEAQPDSIIQALLRSAQDGLLPDGREAALIVFNTKDGKKAQYLPMIGGYRKIAAEYGWSLRTSVVYEKDEFDFELGLDPRLEHRPVRPGAEQGEPIAAYAVARHKHFPTEFEVMTKAEINKVRASSRSSDVGPWEDWTEQMWEKTAGRRLFKKLPLGERDTERVARVIQAEELGLGEASDLLYGPAKTEAEVQISPAATEPGEDGNEKPSASDDFEGDEPPEPESGFKAPDLSKQTVAAGLVVVTFGRHAGRTIEQIYEDDPGYAKWLTTDSVTDQKIKSAAERYVAGRSA
jgi:recombination protein RecT